MKTTIFARIVRQLAVIASIISQIPLAYAQSPYAIFGDESLMLEAKKQHVDNTFRIHIKTDSGAKYFVDFDLKKGIAVLSDIDGNIIRQDSIDETARARFMSIDPNADSYYYLNPYNYCGGDPINRIDPDGQDWYQNNETSYYTWFEGDSEREGYTYIGGKGSVLGEYEEIINTILCGEEGLDLESLYSEGFTFDIAPKDKGGLIGSKERGWNFLDEFTNGTGPEFSVILDDHPYTETVMSRKYVKNCQDIIRQRGPSGKYINVKGENFYPWRVGLTSPMQFIGSYRYDGYMSKDGKHIINIVTDSKSVTSFFYHLPFLKNHRRSEKKHMATLFNFI